MKKINLLLCLSISLLSFSQTNIILKNSWLQTDFSYTLYTSQRMQDALPTLTSDPINLDISDCISNMQSGNVTNQPTFGINDSQPSGTDWMLDYHTTFTYYSLNYVFSGDEYGATRSVPGNPDYVGRYYNVSIVLNSNADIPWNSSGNVDINTILRHESGHLYGLNEYRSMVDHTLMNPYDYQLIDELGQNDINGFRILFEAPTTTIESGSQIVSGNDFSYRINFPVIEFGPDFETLPAGFGFHSYLYKDGVLQSTVPLVPSYIETNEGGTQLFTNSISTSSLALGNYSVRTYSAMFWNQSGDISLYETHNRPYSEVSFKVVANPEIESPPPNENHYIRPSGEKGPVTDILPIKVRVPEVLGSYPSINIKIDDVYVNQGDITFDSGENVWVYNWDVSAETPTVYGKRYLIKAEIDGDPTDYDVIGVYLTEALFYDDFQTVIPGWSATSGWWRIAEPVNETNQIYLTQSQSLYSFLYYLHSPLIQLPPDPTGNIYLEFKIFYHQTGTPRSQFYLSVRNTQNVSIFNATNFYTEDCWTTITFDLTEFAGETIYLRFINYYSGSQLCKETTYAIDNVFVYSVPDTEGPNIDFIAGNTADIDEDMNLTLQFNDASGINGVTADYSIDSDSDTITLYPVKGTYNYTGTISARDHECGGVISFKIKDRVGSETISSLYPINWVSGGGYVLSAPENVLIATENDSTAVLTWDLVPGATGYKVYSSLDPYGTFAEDSTGTFTESRKWEKAFDGDKYFYYIIATDAASKETKRILAPRKTEVK